MHTVNQLGTLHVTVTHGVGLRSADESGLSDPYVKLKLGEEEARSTVCRNTLDPVWNGTFRFRGLYDEFRRQPLKISAWDHDSYSTNDKLGQGGA